MLDDVRALLILQDRDRKLLSLQADLDRIPQEETRAKGKRREDELAVTKAHDALREAELQVKKIELDAQTRRQTILRLKQQQFETRKNEEFQAIAHEITRYEADLDKLETRELEGMELCDQLRAQLQQAEAALAKTQALVDEDLAGLLSRKQRLEEQKAETTAERDKAEAAAPAELLPLYKRLMKTKSGLALAPLREGRCEGCHMKLIPSTIVKVHAALEVVQCEDCGRILYDETA